MNPTDQLDMFDVRVIPTAKARAARTRDELVREAVWSDWRERALEYFRQYALLHAIFITEDVRQHAEKCGFPAPLDKRAWGGVALAARQAGYIAKRGWTTASDPKVHGNPVSEWQSRLRP